MTVSFDLDDLLILSDKKAATEPGGFLQRILGIEPLRSGTKDLFAALRKNGHKIFIYTTSFRSERRIRLTFLLQGLKIDRIINQNEHDRICRRNNIRYSKYPPAFGIDVHVDDLPGVGIEAQRSGYEAIIIDPNDPQWTIKILTRLSYLENPLRTSTENPSADNGTAK